MHIAITDGLSNSKLECVGHPSSQHYHHATGPIPNGGLQQARPQLSEKNSGLAAEANLKVKATRTSSLLARLWSVLEQPASVKAQDQLGCCHACNRTGCKVGSQFKLVTIKIVTACIQFYIFANLGCTDSGSVAVCYSDIHFLWLQWHTFPKVKFYMKMSVNFKLEIPNPLTLIPKP